MRAASRRHAFAVALGGIVLLALGLRLWGTKTGLPYVYNVDEGAHFVPRAVGMFDHSYDPGYFINPPALTYLLHGLFWSRWGGDTTRGLMAADATSVFLYARVTVAMLGAVSVGLIAWVGVRLFDRRVALVAAALLAVAFLPVHYAHFALNDAALLVGVCLCLAGCAGVLHGGRWGDYALAGAGLGMAIATKYTAGMVLGSLVAAALLSPRPRRERVVGLGLAGVLSLVVFLALNPYALLSFDAFRDGLGEQSAASSDGGGKLGLPDTDGLSYYARTLLWGLGVVPLMAAVAGGLALWVRRYRTAMVLLPAPILFLVFMGAQDRFFARWSLPAYPFLALLAAWGAVVALDRLRRVPRPAVVAVAAVVLGLQGFVYVVHNDVVLARADTREDARSWMVDNIPAGAKVVIEPIAPAAWGERWDKRAVSHFRITPDGRRQLVRRPKLEDYELSLRPDLIGSYERGGYCWVVTGSILSGRPLVTPERAPFAIRYYEALRRRAELVYEVSPLARGADEPPFSFDDSYNWRPLGYERPGPRVRIYRLGGGRCA